MYLVLFASCFFVFAALLLTYIAYLLLINKAFFHVALKNADKLLPIIDDINHKQETDCGMPFPISYL